MLEFVKWALLAGLSVAVIGFLFFFFRKLFNQVIFAAAGTEPEDDSP